MKLTKTPDSSVKVTLAVARWSDGSVSFAVIRELNEDSCGTELWAGPANDPERRAAAFDDFANGARVALNDLELVAADLCGAQQSLFT